MNDKARAEWNDMGVPRARFFAGRTAAELEEARTEFSLDSAQSVYASRELERRAQKRRSRNDRMLLAMTALILVLTLVLVLR